MTPSFLDNMSWRMAEVYGAVTDRILINLSKYFAFVNDSAEVKDSFEYQARMLAKMGQVTKETVDIIANSLDGADAALRAALEAAILNALRNEEPKLRQAAQLGLLGAVPPSFAPDQSQAFKAYYQQSADKLNLVNTVMIESTQAAYSATVADAAARLERTQGFLNVAAGETVTGVSTYNQAMRGAVAKMVQNGLTGFIDHAGRRWTPESYVAMDIRTTMFRTARAAVWERQDQYGNDLYQVSSHNGARPLCYPWQGKVISRSDTVRDVTDLDGNTVHVYAQSETSYGQAAGLFGVNCGHYPMSFIPGVSTLKGEPQDPEENEKTYAESQEQRALERKLRAERRDLAVMKAQGESPEAIRKQQERVKAASAEIDDFCDRTGRARRKLREYTPIDAKWPAKDSYDPQTFPHEQKDKLTEWFKNDNNNPPPTPTSVTPVQSAEPVQSAQPAPVLSETPAQLARPQTWGEFTPAKTIGEAEEFAKSFVDTNMWMSYGLSYQGVSVDTANIVNKRLSNFYNTYNVDKFSSLVAPAGNTKLGKQMRGAHAGFVSANRAFVLNRQSLKNPELIAADLAREKDLVKDYLKDPSRYPRFTGILKRVLDNSKVSGRGTVADTLEEIIDHECGHALEKALKRTSNYNKIVEGWKTYGERISGYATESINEYIAESFCSWNKGEGIVDPEIIKGFLEISR